MPLVFNSGHPLAGNVTHLIAVDTGALVEVKAGALSFTVDPDASFGSGTYGAHLRTAGVGFTPDGATWTPAIACNIASSGWTVFIVVNAVTQIWGGQGGILKTDGSYGPNVKIDPAVPAQGDNTGYGTGTLSMSGGSGSIAMTRAAGDAPTTIAYKNGSVSVSASGGFGNSGGAITGIGGNGSGAAINLDMVYLVVFNRVLTGTEISDLHATLGASNTFGLLGAADSTAPVLTSPTGTATGATTATVGATTDEGNGTLYAVVTTSATQPSVAQIKAGQTHTGAAAPWGGSVVVTSTGAKTLNATGLTASTGYYAHLVHADAANNNSNRVSSALFTTSSLPHFDLTLANRDFSTNNGTPIASTALTFWAHNPTTGALVAQITGLSTNASGIVTAPVAHASLAPSTLYRLNYEFSDGKYGVLKVSTEA